MGSYNKQLQNRFEPETAPKVPHGVETLAELQIHIEDEYQRRQRRPRVEETHIRTTFLLDRQLSEKLNRICANREKGFKTLCLNRAIEAIVREYDHA